MRSAIAIIMAVLGTILVLSGAAALWALALARPAPADATEAGAGVAGTRADRTLNALSRLTAPDRLIIWGVVLLALSAVATGAIQVSATATAGTDVPAGTR